MLSCLLVTLVDPPVYRVKGIECRANAKWQSTLKSTISVHVAHSSVHTPHSEAANMGIQFCFSKFFTGQKRKGGQHESRSSWGRKGQDPTNLTIEGQVHLLEPSKEVGGWLPIKNHRKSSYRNVWGFFMRGRKYFLTFFLKYEKIHKI